MFSKRYFILFSALVAGTMALSTNNLQASAAIDSGSTEYQAMLIGSMGGIAQWSSSKDATVPPLEGSELATVTGDGQYTVSFSASSSAGSIDKIDFLCLQIENMTTDNFPQLGITIDKVNIDGKDIDYKTTPSNINLDYYSSRIGSSRVYLTVTDGWGTEKTEDIKSATKVSDKISVTFTVTGTSSGPVTTTLPSDASSVTKNTIASTTSGSALSNSSTTTTTTTPVKNSTTGDNGIGGAVAAIVLAGAIAVVSCTKRR